MGKITDDELAVLSDEERAALEDDSDGATADAAKPGDENKDDDADAGEGSEKADAAGGEKDGADDEAKPQGDEQADAAAKDDEDEGDDTDDVSIPEPVTPVLSAPDVAGFDEQIATLEAARKDIRTKYRAGELSADAYDDQMDEITRQLTAIEGDKRDAASAERYNRDIETSRYIHVLNEFKRQVNREQGIDYDKSPKLLDMFDAEIKTLAADAKNEDKTYDWFLKTAHQNVLAEQEKIAASLGFVKPSKGGAEQPGAQKEAVRTAINGRKPVRPAVGSLATVPSAAGEQPNASEFAHLENLNGDDLEMAVARMSPEQQDRWARAS